MKRILMTLACVMFFISITSCKNGAVTPSDAATECIELIKAKNYKGFVETINMSETATPEEIEQAKQMYVSILSDKGEKQIKQKGGIVSYSIISEDIADDGQTAIVKYKLTYGDGSIDAQKFEMILVDGHWKQNITK